MGDDFGAAAAAAAMRVCMRTSEACYSRLFFLFPLSEGNDFHIRCVFGGERFLVNLTIGELLADCCSFLWYGYCV